MLKLLFTHDRELDEHAQRLVRYHLTKFAKDNPKIDGRDLAHEQRSCDCGATYWVPNNSSRWECAACKPQGGNERAVGFGS